MFRTKAITGDTTLLMFARDLATEYGYALTESADVRPGEVVVDPKRAVAVVHPDAVVYPLTLNAGVVLPANPRR